MILACIDVPPGILEWWNRCWSYSLMGSRLDVWSALVWMILFRPSWCQLLHIRGQILEADTKSLSLLRGSCLVVS